MASGPPPPSSRPQGIGEHDYEDIEAAVTETVRGRWFLGEFARRNRTAEMRQLLDAMARLESAVAQPALPSADPSVRLMIQRIKEIAGTLDGIAGQLRDAGVDERYAQAVEGQARAVSGMLRGATPVAKSPAATPAALSAQSSPAQSSPSPSSPVQPTMREPRPAAGGSPPVRWLPRADLPAPLAPPSSAPPLSTEDRGVLVAQDDPRLTLLSGLDGLSLAAKLALFT